MSIEEKALLCKEVPHFFITFLSKSTFRMQKNSKKILNNLKTRRGPVDHEANTRGWGLSARTNGLRKGHAENHWIMKSGMCQNNPR